MSKVLLFSLTVFFYSVHSFGWGSNGHRIVGKIAELHLTAKASTEVKKLLGVETLAKVSNWPDFIKSNPNWRKAGAWHYVSIPDDKSYKTSEKNKKGDIIEAIRRMTNILKNKKKPTKERARALKFLVHFVGDIHQPLHVGHKHDRGGNDVRLKWFGKSTNLHRIWDTDLIEMQKLSYSEYVHFVNHASKKEISKWQKDDVLVWAKESKALRKQVYDIVENSGNYGKYGEFKYNYKNIKTLDQRLLQGGIRLAGLLNKSL